MATFTMLPADIVHEMLCAMPDFARLSTMVRLSKAHTFSVFEVHKRAILSSVFLNIAGIGMQDVYRLFRHKPHQHGDLPIAIIFDDLLTLSKEERQRFEMICHTLNKLEDVFSQK